MIYIDLADGDTFKSTKENELFTTDDIMIKSRVSCCSASGTTVKTLGKYYWNTQPVEVI